MLLANVVLNELDELYNGTVAKGQVDGLVALPEPGSISHLKIVVTGAGAVGTGVGLKLHPVHASVVLVVE